jgi:hypothetical protein
VRISFSWGISFLVLVGVAPPRLVPDAGAELPEKHALALLVQELGEANERSPSLAEERPRGVESKPIHDVHHGKIGWRCIGLDALDPRLREHLEQFRQEALR